MQENNESSKGSNEVTTTEENLETQHVSFETGMDLSEDTRGALTRHCVARIRDLAGEMGRGSVNNCIGWMGRREKWLRQYRNDWDYRKAEEGGVFAHSNYSMNFAKRICVQLTAKTNREFFGVEPYFAVAPEGVADKDLAERINKRSQWKFSKSNAKSALREAVKYAYILGERVVKISYAEKTKVGTTEAFVLVDDARNIVKTSAGNCIFKDDWVLADDKWVCRHDVSLEMPTEARYELRKVENHVTQYKGPHLSGVHFRDFLCPLNVSDIHEADFICHLYDQPLWSVAQTYHRLDLLRRMDASGDAKSGLAQAEDWRGEEESQGRAVDAIVQIAECYLKFDVNGDGLPEDICVILALPTDTSSLAEVIYYDFCANILPNGRWPFEVVRRNPDEGRWYGVGIFEEFSHKQDFIDLHFNRINFRNMTTGTIKFWKNRDVEEEKEALTIGDDKVWTPKENVDPLKIFTAVPLFEPTEAAEGVMQYMMQSFQLEAGVHSEGDAKMTRLPSSDTATGILSNERSADDLSHLQICDLEEGISKAILAAILMDYDHMDALETYEYLEGDTARLEQLTREDAANLTMNVKLLLTKRRSQQMLEAGSQAIRIMETYVALMERVKKLGLSLEIVSRARALFVQTLKSLEIQNAEEILLDPMQLSAQRNSQEVWEG